MVTTAPEELAVKPAPAPLIAVARQVAILVVLEPVQVLPLTTVDPKVMLGIVLLVPDDVTVKLALPVATVPPVIVSAPLPASPAGALRLALPVPAPANAEPLAILAAMAVAAVSRPPDVLRSAEKLIVPDESVVPPALTLVIL